MTKLTITICAADDREAVGVLDRLRDMMSLDVYDPAAKLNDAGYASGHVDGNGLAEVDRRRVPESVQP